MLNGHHISFTPLLVNCSPLRASTTIETSIWLQDHPYHR
uniref:Uncharacterized protein n=1 Tax=Arundo donax TaxID=35708 RepID=A0A0A8YEP2_ARUDO